MGFEIDEVLDMVRQRFGRLDSQLEESKT
jgi:hypothetical protein